MITKAYIINKEQNSNKYYVRIPIFEKPGINSENSNLSRTHFSATLAHEPTIFDAYNIGDCVFVGFENNELNRPVIIGKLYTKNDTSATSGLIETKVLTVLDKVTLPADTTIGGINFSNISNFFNSINDTLNKKDIFVDSIQFKTNTEGAGLVNFNDKEGLAQITLSPNVTMTIGVDEVLKVYNDTDEILLDGQVVYITDSETDIVPVSLAVASDYAQTERVIGVVTETIGVGSSGFVTRRGFVGDIVLDPNIYTVGQTLYLSPDVEGTFTNQRPVAPNFVTQIGYVNMVSSDSYTADGQIYVDIVIIPTASDIPYDNSASGLESQTVKDALDELSADISMLTPEAIDITTDVSQFNNILSSDDTNVQHALNTLDNHTHSISQLGAVPDTRKIADINLKEDITTTELTAKLDEVTSTTKGLMSPADKTALDTITGGDFVRIAISPEDSPPDQTKIDIWFSI